MKAMRLVATWIVDPDGRVRLARQFQIRHPESGRTLARGHFKFVCTNLDTGKAVHAANLQETYVMVSEPVISE